MPAGGDPHGPPDALPTPAEQRALLEALLSFVIAVADEKIITRVEEFHRRRHDLGIYRDTPE